MTTQFTTGKSVVSVVENLDENILAKVLVIKESLVGVSYRKLERKN